MSRYRGQHPAPRTRNLHKPNSPHPNPQKILNTMNPSSRISKKKDPMHTAIQEALTCTSCKIDPPRPTPGVDRKSREESPTTITADTEAKSLAPTTTKSNSVYEPWMTLSQKELYENLVDQLVSQDPKRNERFARYRVDYHIFVHYKYSRGVLSLCRDRKDVDEMKCWMKGMADGGSKLRDWTEQMAKLHAIELVSGTDPDRDKAAMPVPGNWKVYVPDLDVSRDSPWPNDEKLSMKHQEDLWEQRELTRQKRVQKSRDEWKKVMKERARQRRLALEERKKQTELQMAQQSKIKKVKFYWGKGILREMALDSPW
ncbi:hypothetical protein BBP40_010483 [Aspergillus hancockii]|nr:hypothetical protein BBP40_010483 [Aspergillus hancockii]